MPPQNWQRIRRQSLVSLEFPWKNRKAACAICQVFTTPFSFGDTKANVQRLYPGKSRWLSAKAQRFEQIGTATFRNAEMEFETQELRKAEAACYSWVSEFQISNGFDSTRRRGDRELKQKNAICFFPVGPLKSQFFIFLNFLNWHFCENVRNYRHESTDWKSILTPGILN